MSKSILNAWNKISYLASTFVIAIALIFLPITSFPWLVKISGASTIAPISIPFFFVVGVLWVIPSVFQFGEIALENKPFAVFLLVVILSWALSFFIAIPPYKDHLVTTAYKEAFVTLGIAAAIYIVMSSWTMQRIENVEIVLKFISLGGGILLLWCLAQVYVVFFLDGDYPSIFIKIQRLISSRRGTHLFTDRVTGMAYEPSWLAHQLVVLYIPLWFSFSIYRQSAFKRMIWKFSVENLLLAAALLVLFATFSRIGWFSFLLILTYSGVSFAIFVVRRVTKHILINLSDRLGSFLKGIVALGVFFALGLLLLGVTVGLIYLGSKLEPRIARILTYDFSEATSFLFLTNLLFFAERAVYWVAGWEVFNHYPWFGVGIGNVGFFFPDTMPSFGYGLTEIRDLFYRLTYLPNTKSIWIRLFAETGIVGVSTFLSWIFVVVGSTFLMRKFGSRVMKPIGLLGQFSLIAFISEGFSIDSFSLPYFWLVMGLVTGSAAIVRKNLNLKE